MSEIERVQALRDAGHITAEEAERLIGVLRELDADVASADLASADVASPAAATGSQAADGMAATPALSAALAPDATQRPGVPSYPPAPPMPPTPGIPPVPQDDPATPPGSPEMPEPPTAPEPPGAPDAPRPPRPPEPGEPVEPPERAETTSRMGAATGRSEPATERTEAATAAGSILSVPEGTRWCSIELLAADLDVIVDDVSEPVVEADEAQMIEVTPTADGFRIAAKRGVSFEGWIGRMRSLDVQVRLPRAWGLSLDLKAGDATVRDVPYVHGRMLAGDLEVWGAEAVDVSKAAGDLKVVFRPTQGRHRIASKAGDVEVEFLAGSQATVEGSVSMGDLHARGFDVERRTVGAQARGRMGSGAAEVEVRLTAGDLELRAPRAEG